MTKTWGGLWSAAWSPLEWCMDVIPRQLKNYLFRGIRHYHVIPKLFLWLILVPRLANNLDWGQFRESNWKHLLEMNMKIMPCFDYFAHNIILKGRIE